MKVRGKIISRVSRLIMSALTCRTVKLVYLSIHHVSHVLHNNL